MKNVFKFLGIASVAGALMTACGEKYTVTVNVDNTMGTVTGAGEYAPDATCTLTATPNAGYEFVNWTNGTTTITDNPYTFNVTGDVTLTANFIVKGVKVDFGTESWTATSCLGDDYSEYGLLGFGAFKNYENANAPFIQGYFRSTVGSATHASGDYNYFFYYENENDFMTDTDGSLSGQAGAQLPNWQPGSQTQQVTAIDLNACTISGNVHGNSFYLPDYVNNVETTRELNITVNNAQWEWAEGKSMKKMNVLK